MMTLTNIIVVLFIVFTSIIVHQTHSFSFRNRETINEIAMKPDSIDDTSSSNDQYGSIENPFPTEIHSFLNKRHTDSAEKYFDWASKTNRPMEYLRGKRFWLFTKKEEQDINHQAIPSGSASSNLLNHGIWRSGIVGRRR